MLVTHGGYLHFLTGDWVGYGVKFTGTGWANTEFRSYQFAGDDEEALVVETLESRERRQGSEQSLSADEQRELKDAALQEGITKGFMTL